MGELELDDLQENLAPVAGKPGRFVIVGRQAESMAEEGADIEAIGTASFRVAAEMLNHVEQAIAKAEAELAQAPASADKPAS